MPRKMKKLWDGDKSAAKKEPGRKPMGRRIDIGGHPGTALDKSTGREMFVFRGREPKTSPYVYPVLKPSEINGRHQGKLVFILANGPSLLQAEPHIKRISRHITIGINLSYLLMDADHLVWLDKSLYERQRPELEKMRSHLFTRKKSLTPGVNIFAEYKVEKKNGHFTRILSPRFEEGLVAGFTSLFAAINLAYVMGAGEIALLGVDLDNAKHFYTDNPRWESNRFLAHFKDKLRAREKRKTYGGHPMIVEYTCAMAALLKAKGVKCWNCYEHSLANAWDYISLPDLLAMHEEEPAQDVLARDYAYPQWTNEDRL